MADLTDKLSFIIYFWLVLCIAVIQILEKLSFIPHGMCEHL